MTEGARPQSVAEAAEVVEARYGRHIAALMAYGSRVFGAARVGSAFDFWLIVKDPAEFHRDNAEFYRTRLNVRSTPEEQARLNRTGPLFYSLQDCEPEIKLAVLGEETFVALCRDEWWTVKGRMQKPLEVIRSTPAVEAAILSARREGLACGVNLVPREFDINDLLFRIVGLSYHAEIRPEFKSAKIESILEKAREALESIYLPLLDELKYVERNGSGFVDRRNETERRRARRATRYALRYSKWCRRSLDFIWRNFRSHGSPIRYIALKIVGELQKLMRRLFRSA